MGSATLNTKKPSISLYLDDFMDVVCYACKHKKVLDFGSCGHDLGTGLHRYKVSENFRLLSLFASDIVGVDNYSEMVKLAKKRGYNVLLGNAENKKVKKAGFDVVTALAIYEHLDNQSLFLDNAHYNLKKEGLLIIFTINAFSIRNFARVILNGFVPVNSEHVGYYDIKTLTQSLTRHGFEVVNAYHVFGGRFNFTEMFERQISKLRQSFAPNILIIARKK